MSNVISKVVGLCLGITLIGGGGLIMAQSRNAMPLKRSNESVKLMELYAKMAHEALTVQTAQAKSKSRSTTSAEAETILEEDFSKITGGSEAEPGDEIGSYTIDGNSLWPEDITNTPGWWGIGTYAIDGAVGLCYPGMGGVVCTGPADMYGNLHVSFRAKAREGNGEGKSQSLMVSIVNGDIYNPTMSSQEGYQIVNLKAEDGWQDIELNFRNPNKLNDSRLQINGMTYSKAGFIIDDIKITRDFDFCLPPTEMSCRDFNDEGFTITWNQGAENNSYLFSMIQEKKLSGVFDATETFEGTLPQYWSTTGSIVAEGGVDNTKALRIEKSQELTLSFGGGRLARLSIFMRGGQFDENSTAIIKLTGVINNKEGELASINVSKLNASGEELKFNSIISNYIYQLEKIKFTAEGFGDNEYCLIDNVTYLASPACERTQLMSDVPVEETQIILTGLDPENEYYVGIKGVKNEEFISDFFGYFYVPGMPAPKVLDATYIEKRGAYTANWIPSPKAQSYTVYNYLETTVDADQQNYVVLRDDFTKAKDASQVVLDQMYFDEWSDCKGWNTGETPNNFTNMSTVDAGYIGTLFLPIYTPLVSLNNDNGKFTVRFKVKAFGLEKILVYSNDQMQVYDFGEVNPDGDPYVLEEHEVEMQFDNGTDLQSLIITANDYSFFLDWFEITQNVKAGDRIKRFAGVVDVKGHDTTEYRFTGLQNDKNLRYAYNVVANGQYMGQIFNSAPSELTYVNLNGQASVENPLSDEIRVLSAHEGIEVVLPEAAKVKVFTVYGMTAAVADCTEGTSFISLPAGLYIVLIGEHSFKVSVR